MGQSQVWSAAGTGAMLGRHLLVWFTGVLAVAALFILAVQAASGVDGSAEALLVLALLIGALVLAGNNGDRQRHVAGTDRSVAAGTAAAIDALDRVEHRRIELGRPWPQLVVGPTGVTIVDICPHAGPVHLTSEGLHPAGTRQQCDRCDAAAAAARAAEQLLAGMEDGDRVPVRVLAVVAPATTVSRDPGLGTGLDAVPADRLPDRLARGPVLPMALVDRAFMRLASLSGTHRPA